MNRILLIATGGTIASVQSQYGLTPGLSPEQLATYIETDPQATFTVDYLQLFNLDSTNMQPEHWVDIAQCVANHYEQFDGFVITHGTDTMAYTAAALSYLLQHVSKPIVVPDPRYPSKSTKRMRKKM
ncbi:L-asparaginase 1 [Acidibacillus sp. S0AB]|uniref:asparaginase n=1 Tax=Sulfoacidibacillus ferrooxidans TaxID=2005001 RepID=A0A9X1V7D6_9BACL|nr:L-asparaginase 1 [Sulfoacidibacillus ferrooxidans]